MPFGASGSLRTALLAIMCALAVTILLAGPAGANFSASEHSMNTEEATKQLEGIEVGVPPGNPERVFKVQDGGALGGRPKAVVSADFNGDGQDDLAAAVHNRFGPREASSQPDGVAVLLSAPDGSYRRPANYALGAAERHTGTSVVPDPLAAVGETAVADLTVADVNGDGAPDLVAANRGSDSVSVLVNTGTGAFAAGPRGRAWTSQTGAVTSSARYPTGTDPVAVAAADVDGDSDQDVVTANRGSDDVSVLLNDGAGRYATTPSSSPYSVGTDFEAVVFADLDGQDHADVVTANGGDDTVTVLPNQGDGTYPTDGGNTQSVGTDPAGLAAADLDGQHHDDVVTANRGSDDVSVLLSDASGALSPEADSPYEVDGNSLNDAKPVAVAAAQVGSPGSAANDGDFDLATANSASNDVSVLLHDGTLDDGDTGFSQEPNSPYQVGYAPVSLTAGDFDPQAGSDIDPDLATPNTSSESLTLLHNTP
jgi:hypothetical protein